MSEPKLISPMLDQFVMGAPFSQHHGVQCCPAMENKSNDKYIVKVISVPATQSQMDALLLSGAYSDEAAALQYFKESADGIAEEVQILDELSAIDGFIPYRDSQIVPKDDGKGYDVYLLGAYRRTLTKHFKRHVLTHLDALNLGLDICSALAVCRRSGYLYVDLKPSNIFVTGDREYKIGDLGFVRLNSLKYAALPDRYLSEYTAPEIVDAYSVPNTTIDIYAAGLILYQAYNNGELPPPMDPDGGEFTAPLYADYEMSEIIRKACAANPEDRWQEPMQMGQAIVSYMQRNGASDLPIVPIASDDDADTATEIPPLEDAPVDDNPTSSESKDTQTVASEEFVENDPQDSSDAVIHDTQEEPNEIVYLEDDFGNLSFLDDIPLDETDPAYHSTQIDYAEVSDEVSEMLSQADELASLSVPEPVIVPEHVEIPIPSLPEETPEDLPENTESTEDAIGDNNAAVDTEASDKEESTEKTPPIKKKHWLRNSILILLLLALIAGGIYYYQNYYLMPVEIVVLEGSEDTLTVQITSNIDETLLRAICSDTYGNQIPAPVVNGTAVFTGLVPDTAYSIHIVTDGFHRLTGNTSTAYSTPVQTNIVQFGAVTGSTDGSVILSFTVDGPDCEEWIVSYSADGEEAKSVSFPSHTVTITGLSVGKEYTFQISPKKNLYISGTDTLKFTASQVIHAQNLTVDSFMDGKLAVSWTAPEDSNVENWTVRCYNDSYNESIITPNTNVIFEGIDHGQSYQIEVTASGMSTCQRTSIEKDTITAYNFVTDATSSSVIGLTWETSQTISDTGWVLRYYADGLSSDEIMLCDDNYAVISPVIPGATYYYRLEDIEGNVLLGSDGVFTVPEGPAFSCDYEGYHVTAEHMTFHMCRTPDNSNWNRYDLSDDDYTTSFRTGERASFLVHLSKAYGVSNDDIVTLFVIRDNADNLVDASHITNTWISMWYRNYCELDIPALPAEPGEYTIEVYLNGALAATQTFLVSA